MKRYTGADFEKFERDKNGHIICPRGEYLLIRDFPAHCAFDDGCSFGELCGFGEQCSFGEGCSFGEQCRFSEQCRFGVQCSFGEHCSHEGLTDSIYTAFDRIGRENRKAYFFKAQEGYYVRTGCFFGSLEDFQSNVGETHGGTIHEQTYFMAGELAKKILAHEWDKHHAETDLPA